MMKCIAILSIMAVLLSGQVLSREYILEPTTEPLNSRSFNLFNLFNQNKVSSSTRLTNLESAVAPIISGFANLQNQVAALITRLTADEGLIAQLQASIAAILTRLTAAESAIEALKATPAAKCPGTAPSTAKIVSGKCYSVFSNAVTFAAAQTTCNAGSGKLAEPTVAEASALYAALQTAFQGPTTTIAGNGAWIGVVQAAGGGATSPFTYVSNPTLTAVTNNQLTGGALATLATTNAAAFLATPTPVAATPFTAIDITPPLAGGGPTAPPTKGFICQY